MLNFSKYRHTRKALAAAVVLGMLFAVAGCGKSGQQQQGGQATLVKSMQVIKRDTPLVYEYTGFVQANREMELKAQVTGRIMSKHFKGGDVVTEGQALYTIDSRTYAANLMNAQAAYDVAAADAERYANLYAKSAVSKQTLDNANMIKKQALANLTNAQVNMTDTTVVAPFTGRIDTTSLEVGNYVTQGQTTMGTISDTNPVYVKFTMAEPEYLRLAAAKEGAGLNNLTAVLSDGSTYPIKGKVTEVNRGINDNTGSMTIRAQFENPNRLLLPGMFAHIQAVGDVRKDALLVPQRAITELMYKKFVYVIGSDKKAKMQEVTLGKTVGRLVIVESGLKGDENIVVEGTGKLRNGVEVNAKPMTEQELDTSNKDAAVK